MHVHACNNRYTAELGEHTLLHFLALVALLDKAKERGIVPGVFVCICLYTLYILVCTNPQHTCNAIVTTANSECYDTVSEVEQEHVLQCWFSASLLI
jgi:hypothetical protein